MKPRCQEEGCDKVATHKLIYDLDEDFVLYEVFCDEHADVVIAEGYNDLAHAQSL